MSGKEHFSSPQWVDFVRDQLDGAIAAEMDRHLRADCAPCAAAFEAWRLPVLFAEEERWSAPPQAAVRIAKALFAQAGLAHERRARNPLALLASATFATLVFDSRLATQAGVRAAATYSRHLLFDAKSLVVDLHVDSGAPDGSIELTGQIVDDSGSDQALDGVYLSIVDDRRKVSAVTLNEFREFRCTVRDTRAEFLVVDARKDVVAIPLNTLYDRSPDSAASCEHSKVKR